MSIHPVVDIHAAKRFLSDLSPDLSWLLRQIESDDGHCRFPSQVTKAITNLKIESYPLLYESEAAIGLVLFMGFLSKKEIAELDRELSEASIEERGQFLQEFCQGLADGLEQIEIPKTPADEQRANEQFNALSSDEQAEAIKMGQHFWMSFLAGFFQMLSVMVHGEKLTALVAKAKNGDDDAFVKAVQIDKRILTTIPYFKQRFEGANLEGDRDFVDALTYRLQCAPYRGKIRHKSLWLAFSFLDMCGLLDALRHQELLDLLDEVGLGGYPNRIEDVKYLSKRLADFRRFRGYGLTLSTP